MCAAPQGPDRLDLAVVARQLGRAGPGSVHPVARVMVRCPWQLPAVVEDLPYDAAGRPFPTLFYLTCPSARAAVHRVESGGGLRDMEAMLARSPELRASLRAAERYERRRRRRLAARGRGRGAGAAPAARDGGSSLSTGVAGRRRDVVAQGESASIPLKCLHAHVAHALARPGYEVGELVIKQAGGRTALWCDDARCLRLGSQRSDDGLVDPLKVAAVDLGTNTCRLLLAEVGRSWCGPVRQERRTSTVVRLGQGVDASRRLVPEAVARTRDCLAGYAGEIESFQPDVSGLIATSALRDAADGESFLAGVQRDFSLPWRILSGAQEGATTFRGATCGVAQTDGTVMVVDSGGGSTELVAGSPGAREPGFDCSIDIGAVRVTERFFDHDPPTSGEWTAAVRHVRTALRDGVPPDVRREVDGVVGVAGTVATLVAVKLGLREYRAEVVDGQPLHLREIDRAIGLFRVLSSGQRYHLPGMQPGREDVILAGAMIAREACRLFDAPGLVYSEADILEGVALMLADEARERRLG